MSNAIYSPGGFVNFNPQSFVGTHRQTFRYRASVKVVVDGLGLR
jgi:hypothetical protein